MNAGLDTAKAAAANLAHNHQLLIDGRWCDAASGRRFDTYDPATGNVIARVAEAGTEDIDDAVRAARASLRTRSWVGLSADARARVLWRYADLLELHATELAELEVLNNGMPMAFANWMVSASASWLRYYAGSVSRIHGKTAGNAMHEAGRAMHAAGRAMHAAGRAMHAAGRAMHAYTVREPVGVVGLI